jgi:hypothetical protein
VVCIIVVKLENPLLDISFMYSLSLDKEHKFKLISELDVRVIMDNVVLDAMAFQSNVD